MRWLRLSSDRYIRTDAIVAVSFFEDYAKRPIAYISARNDTGFEIQGEDVAVLRAWLDAQMEGSPS